MNGTKKELEFKINKQTNKSNTTVNLPMHMVPKWTNIS